MIDGKTYPFFHPGGNDGSVAPMFTLNGWTIFLNSCIFRGMGNDKGIKIVVSKGGDTDMDPKERRLKELILGAKPENDFERAIVKDLEEMATKGIMPDIPFNL